MTTTPSKSTSTSSASSSSVTTAMTTSKATEEHLTNLLTNPKSFSIASYLNTALSMSTPPHNNSSSEEELQTKMAELALQLQVQTQSCHDEIGRIGAELRAILPRCAGDLGRLHVGLGGMREDAASLLDDHLKSSLGYVDSQNGSNGSNDSNNDDNTGNEEDDEMESSPSSSNENGENIPPNQSNNHNASSSSVSSSLSSTMMTPLETLETLSTLHALQQNLTQTKSILHSVSTYDKTITTLPSLLTSSQNLNHAVSALITLENGARALSALPGHTQRLADIKETRNKIITLLKPELLHALQKMESRLGPLQTCVGMYHSLGKIESLMEEYVKNRPSSVHKLWFEFGKANSHCSSSSSSNQRRAATTTATSTATRDDLEFYGDGLDDKELFGDDYEQPHDDESKVDTMTSSSSMMKLSFVEWLPTWYEAVLLLLSEEQRRALTVFGPELAPEIMAKILNECFRPIISSFKARLSSIVPSNVKQVTTFASSSSSGSFENICSAYEATLQFLSVAYESMVDFNTSSNTTQTNTTDNNSGDNKNTTLPSRTKTQVELYHMIRSTFMTIASPFAPYQECYSEYEANHSGMTARVVSRDIHDAVTVMKISNSTSLLQSLQDAVEKLTNLAPFIFPLAQAAVVRYESFNSGYKARKALAAIDTLVARHTSELSIAIHTLFTNMMSCSNKVTETFDEQQVQYALEVLKIAGLIRRDLVSFEEKTRDRLRILIGRVSAAIEEECAVNAAIASSNHSTTSTTWSQIPDSLSAAEIEAMLAMNVCGEDGDEQGLTKSPSILVLQRLANPDKVGKKVALFPDTVDSVSRLVKSCQTFVFDICSVSPMNHLESMAALPIWKQEESLWSSSAPDSYGTLPQAYITQVGEHMLALVQALEPFASDKNALMLVNLVMEDVEHVSMKSWKSLIDAIDYIEGDNNEEVIQAFMKGKQVKDLVIGQKSLQSFDEDETLQLEEDEDNNDVEMHTFCNKWLDAVCTAVTGQLLDRTMRIPHLSQKGCDHLSADYNYIVNVFTALGVSGHPHPMLSHIAEVSKMDSKILRDRLNFLQTNHGQSSHGKIMFKIDTRIAEMRGISF